MYNTLLELLFIAFLYVYTTEAKSCTGWANYTLTRRGDWTDARHPNSPPASVRGFSETVGCSHNARYVMWAPGIKATTGVKNVAEAGNVTAIEAEMDIQIALKKAFKRYVGVMMVGGRSNDTIPNIEVNSEYPFVSFISMIAPSPDWFVGVRDLNLCNTATGEWRDREVRELFPYDAGTDSGVNFTSPDEVTNPPINIHRITNDTEGSLKGDKPVLSFGTFTFVKTSESVEVTSAPPLTPTQTANPGTNFNKKTLVLMLCIWNIIGYLL
ncbi:Hypothetical predicted protein [Paramuricea clavata]|uniref:Uncharacterized protein n=1 Tax=Paramuricea clavata TaxID=317549 RepID=A0A7D9ICU4_PARCT|nr:Hypothetical predicted protein [Paramuricea clavata]